MTDEPGLVQFILTNMSPVVLVAGGFGYVLYPRGIGATRIAVGLGLTCGALSTFWTVRRDNSEAGVAGVVIVMLLAFGFAIVGASIGLSLRRRRSM